MLAYSYLCSDKLTIKMRKAVLLTCYFLMGWVDSLSAQPQCTVTHYDEFSGMAQWYVTQIVQDKQGMMWFATWNGLNRYDGYEFVNFKSQKGDGVDIPSDRMRDMILNEEGHLLCSYDHHVFLFNVNTCRFNPLPTAEEQKMIKVFEQRHHQDISNSAPFEHRDSTGTLWRIHRDGKLFYQVAGSNEWHPYPSGFSPMSYLHYGMTDREGNVWMRSGYGIYKLTFGQKKFQSFEPVGTDQTRSFCLDRKKRYWITTRNDKIIQLFDKENRLLGYLGRDGQLHANYTSFGSPIYHVMQDSKGVFWLSSKPDGLFRLRETGDGRFQVEQFRHEAGNPQTLSDDELYFTAEDQRGRLWVATFNQGLCCVEDPWADQLVFQNIDNGLSSPIQEGLRVRHIRITSEGILLAATTTGLIVADVSKPKMSDIKLKLHRRDSKRYSSLSCNAVMFIAEDSRHRLFVCTESGGINQIISNQLLDEELEFRHFDMSTGLSSDITLSAVESEDKLLIVSNNQLILLDPDKNQSSSYDTHFWGSMLRFSDAIPLLLPDGRRIFGLQNGAITLLPDKIRKSNDIPPIALTSISIHGDSLNLAVNGLDTLLLNTREERDVTISFSALDYRGGGIIHYAYQWDDNGGWVNIGKDHSTTFLNLQPGTYQLKIRSTNSDGVWVDNTRLLTIIVKPVFWETRWAQLIYILLFLTLLWLVFYTFQYIRRIKRQQKETHEAYLALLNANQESQVTEQARQEPMKPHIKPEDEAFMQRAMKFIEDHISDLDVNIGDMAEATATSRSGLNRKMKSLLGVTPLDFIREARIRKACTLLSQGAMVKDVAYACGFSDVIYFRKCFKAEIGMAPSEYRDEKFGK